MVAVNGDSRSIEMAKYGEKKTPWISDGKQVVTAIHGYDGVHGVEIVMQSARAREAVSSVNSSFNH